MFCENCGREIKEESKFCPYCGCEIKNSTLNNRKISNTEIGAQTNKKKSKIPFIIGIGVVIVLIIILIPKGKNAKQTVDKLQSFTYMTGGSIGTYYFEYGDEWNLIYEETNIFETKADRRVGDKDDWELIYRDTKKWVEFYDDAIYYCLAYALDVDQFDNGGKFIYDFSENECNVDVWYQDDESKLDVINYSFDTDELTLMVDGEEYEPSETFEQNLRDSGLIEIFEDDLDVFKRQLEDNGTSFDEISNLSYKKIKKVDK